MARSSKKKAKGKGKGKGKEAVAKEAKLPPAPAEKTGPAKLPAKPGKSRPKS